MSTAVQYLRDIQSKCARDSKLSLHRVLHKSFRYAMELLTARIYLMGATKVGTFPRTCKKPRIENWGTLMIGDEIIITSKNVPAELAVMDNAKLIIGNHVRINYGVSICATEEIHIGDRSRVGPYTMIVDSDFHDVYKRNSRPKSEPVFIEEDVWIGAKVSILKGVRIGKGSIVGTGAVVNRSVPPFTIVAGVPAKPVGTIDPIKFYAEPIKS